MPRVRLPEISSPTWPPGNAWRRLKIWKRVINMGEKVTFATRWALDCSTHRSPMGYGHPQPTQRKVSDCLPDLERDGRLCEAPRCGAVVRDSGRGEHDVDRWFPLRHAHGPAGNARQAAAAPGRNERSPAGIGRRVHDKNAGDEGCRSVRRQGLAASERDLSGRCDFSVVCLRTVGGFEFSFRRATFRAHQDQNRMERLSSEQLVEELYTELRLLASARIRLLTPGQTLQATALVHEAYLRLARQPSACWDSPGHFFSSAAEAMRRILIEQARRKSALRRAGNAEHERVDEIELQSPEPEERLLAVHGVLDELVSENPLQAQIVKLRFFAGLNHSEVGGALKLSEKTVRRQWNLAKVWIYQRICESQGAGMKTRPEEESHG